MIIHSKTYTKGDIFNIVHRQRLNLIRKMIREINNIPDCGKLADFGCSDGFILNIFKSEKRFKIWEMFGFDHAEEFIEIAKQKYPYLKFNFLNLNIEINNNYKECFDIVTCFETLEHVGNYKVAFNNLYYTLKPGGFMVISVPNEVFLIGLIKFTGRYIKGNFYEYNDILKSRRDKIKYIFSLIFNKDIEKYRKYPQEGFSAHLGFNYRNLEKYINQNYIYNKKLKVLNKKSSFFGFNKIYVFKKCR